MDKSIFHRKRGGTGVRDEARSATGRAVVGVLSVVPVGKGITENSDLLCLAIDGDSAPFFLTRFLQRFKISDIS